MNLKAIFAAAGLAAAVIGLTAPAEAHDRYERRWDHSSRWDHHGHWDRHDRRSWRDDRRWDHGRHYGWRSNNHCWTEWRRGDRVRVCR